MSFEVSGALSSKADLHQVFGRHRERDGIADRLVKAVVGAVAEQERLLVVGALIEVVAQFVMDREKIFAGDLDAHLQAHIVDEIDIPGAGMAHHVAVARLDEERALPERLCLEVHGITDYAKSRTTDIHQLTFACGPHHRLLKPGGWTTRTTTPRHHPIDPATHH